MALATWWRGDSVPSLSLLPGFRVEASRDAHLIADITRLAPDEVDQRMHTGHQPYLAFVEQTPVGYGWMATAGSLDRRTRLQLCVACDRSLFMGLCHAPGVARLRPVPTALAAHSDAAMSTVERVWIINAPENSPSGAGMTKAGLLPIGQLSFRGDGGVGLAPFDSLERAQAGAALLGIPLIESVLAPCWHCGGATHTHSTVVDADSCWPPLRPTTQPCTCAIELKPAKTLAA